MKHNGVHKRVMAFLLSFALVFNMVQMTGISAFAAESGGVTAYYSDEGLFKDSGYTQDARGDSAYLKTVTQIMIKDSTETIVDAAFHECSHLTGIAIPDSVTSIGENAFGECTSLQTVTFGAGSRLDSIGVCAFSYCTQLGAINIPDTVTSIWDGAFAGCTAMQSITVGPHNNNYFSDGVCLLSKDGTRLIACAGGKTGSYQVPDSVSSIGNDAFSGSNLTGILFGSGSSLTNVGQRAFAACVRLTGLTLPDSVIAIGQGAFSGCSSLKSMILPENIQRIRASLFQGCSSLTTVTIPKTVTIIDSRFSAFRDCRSLQAINVERGSARYCSYDGVVYTIGRNGDLTLNVCPLAKAGTCTVKAGTTTIASAAFEGCSKLTDITLPEGLTTIQSDAFENCTGLTRIDLPESVTQADDGLFNGCSHLKAVAVSTNTLFQDDTFSFISNLYVAEGEGDTDHSPACANKFYFTKPAGGSSYQFQSYAGTKVGIVVPTELYGKPVSPAIQESELAVTPFTAYSDGNSLYSDRGYQSAINPNRRCEVTNVVIGSDVQVIYGSAFGDCSSLTEIDIPASVRELDDNPFSGCSALQHITVDSNNSKFCSEDGVMYFKEDSDKLALVRCPNGRTGKFEIPSNVNAIGYSALEDCTGLTSVTIPSGVIYIGEDAFYGCAGLTNVTIPAGVTDIGEDAFYDCTGLTNVTIPAGITAIGDRIFANCTGLTNVTIPSEVTAIGEEAFEGCAGLNTVVLEGASTTLDADAFNLSQYNNLRATLTLVNSSDNILDHSTLTVYVPQANLDYYNTEFSRDVLGNTAAEIKAIPVISAFDTPNAIIAPKGSALTGLNLPQTLLATVNGTPHTEVDGITWNADRPYDPNATGFYSFTPVLPFYCRTVNNLSMPKLSVHVVDTGKSISSGTSILPLPLPSGVTDAVSNAQVDLSGATMPAGVTKVTLSVTPEAANGTPATPGTAGGAGDPQGAAAFHLAVTDTSLNIIGTPVLYNLKLLDQNGNPITGFSGKVTVKIPLPTGLHGTPHVFRYEESTGTFTDMNAVVENGFLVFSTEHFSYYAVAGVGDSVTLDTKSYQMPVGGKYQIGLKLTGSKATTVKFHSTNDKIATVAKLKNANYQVTGKGTGTVWIMFDVYDRKNHLLTHASTRIDVKTGIRPRGDSTRQIGAF